MVVWIWRVASERSAWQAKGPLENKTWPLHTLRRPEREGTRRKCNLLIVLGLVPLVHLDIVHCSTELREEVLEVHRRLEDREQSNQDDIASPTSRRGSPLRCCTA